MNTSDLKGTVPTKLHEHASAVYRQRYRWALATGTILTTILLAVGMWTGHLGATYPEMATVACVIVTNGMAFLYLLDTTKNKKDANPVYYSYACCSVLGLLVLAVTFLKRLGKGIVLPLFMDVKWIPPDETHARWWIVVVAWTMLAWLTIKYPAIAEGRDSSIARGEKKVK